MLAGLLGWMMKGMNRRKQNISSEPKSGRQATALTRDFSARANIQLRRSKVAVSRPEISHFNAIMMQRLMKPEKKGCGLCFYRS